MGLERAAWLERRYGARIEWRPFYLHPEYPPEGITREALHARYGGEFTGYVRSVIEAAGLPYAPPAVVPNTLASLEVGEFARDAGRLERLHPKLFAAYWAEGRNIGDPTVLAECAASVGLDGERAVTTARENRYRPRVLESTRDAFDAGVTGVPAWLIDGRLLVPGAQPTDVFDRVLERLGYAPV